MPAPPVGKTRTNVLAAIMPGHNKADSSSAGYAQTPATGRRASRSFRRPAGRAAFFRRHAAPVCR